MCPVQTVTYLSGRSAQGQEFVPLGGMHDGGADGFVEHGIYGGSKSGHFMQASLEGDHRAKIRKTIERLNSVGRNCTFLTYCTPRVIQKVDIEEELLSEELSIQVRIRDQKYFVSYINDSVQTLQAFQSFLQPGLSFLNEIGGSTLIRPSPNLPARALCVFLGQEIERRGGNTELLEAVTDSLLLWALEGTDPEKKIFRTKMSCIRESWKHCLLRRHSFAAKWTRD